MRAKKEKSHCNASGLSFEVLDDLLEVAIAARSSKLDSECNGDGASDQLSGLFISEDSVRRTLRSALDFLGTSKNQPKVFSSIFDVHLCGLLASRLRLTPFECDVLAFSYAVELLPKYGRVIAYLSDDISRRNPSIGLACELFAQANDLVECLKAFENESNLVRFGLIDVYGKDAPRHNLQFQLTSGAFRFLSENGERVRYLSQSECAITGEIPDRNSVTFSLRPSLKEIANRLLGFKRRIEIVIAGEVGIGKTEQIRSLAKVLNRSIISINFDSLVRSSGERIEAVSRTLTREAFLKSTLVHIVCAEPQTLSYLFGGQVAATTYIDRDIRNAPNQGSVDGILANFCDTLSSLPQDCAVVIETSLFPEAIGRMVRCQTRFQFIQIDPPSELDRTQAWESELKEFCTDEQQRSSESQCLGEAFRIGFGQIQSSALEARIRDGSIESVWMAARARSSWRLEAFGERIESRANWEDLVLGSLESEQLRDLVRRVRYRSTVINDWGFGSKLNHGTGVNALFAGPPGTGKTMAAEVLANELKIPAYRIETSAVVSKYIGETEKNLESIFVAAKNCDALIFFDEADALFGKRTDVHDAHDRYANLETAYLLQRLERHQGIVVLATNLQSNIDQAFIRRFTQIVNFRFPDEAARRQIWQRVWPARIHLHQDIENNRDRLSKIFEINGGTIKNAALTAAFLAADGDAKSNGATAIVSLEHVIAALGQEYRKLGKTPEKFDWHRSAETGHSLNGVRA